MLVDVLDVFWCAMIHITMGKPVLEWNSSRLEWIPSRLEWIHSRLEWIHSRFFGTGLSKSSILVHIIPVTYPQNSKINKGFRLWKNFSQNGYQYKSYSMFYQIGRLIWNEFIPYWNEFILTGMNSCQISNPGHFTTLTLRLVCRG